MNAQNIAQATKYDPVLSKVCNYVLTGWPQNVQKEELIPYYRRKDELSSDLGCLLWGQRVVIPKKFQEDILTKLHDTHPGIVRMKALA